MWRVSKHSQRLVNLYRNDYIEFKKYWWLYKLCPSSSFGFLRVLLDYQCHFLIINILTEKRYCDETYKSTVQNFTTLGSACWINAFSTDGIQISFTAWQWLLKRFWNLLQNITLSLMIYAWKHLRTIKGFAIIRFP